MFMRSELPPGGPKSEWWDATDRRNHAAWTQDLRVYRKLLRKLCRVERQYSRRSRGGQGNDIRVR